MQLVLKGNRVLAHGENFVAMGGTVVNTVTNKAYQNATIAECASCPSDIDEVGYEYHAGTFVPCAPYGKGGGNIAVVCNEDCKSIKDSGIPLDGFTRKAVTSYIGTAKSGSDYPNSLTFDFEPQIVLITPTEHTFVSSSTDYWGFLQRGAEGEKGAGFVVQMTAQSLAPEIYPIIPTFSGNTVTWYNGKGAAYQLNKSKTYNVVALG